MRRKRVAAGFPVEQRDDEQIGVDETGTSVSRHQRGSDGVRDSNGIIIGIMNDGS